MRSVLLSRHGTVRLPARVRNSETLAQSCSSGHPQARHWKMQALFASTAATLCILAACHVRSRHYQQPVAACMLLHHCSHSGGVLETTTLPIIVEVVTIVIERIIAAIMATARQK